MCTNFKKRYLRYIFKNKSFYGIVEGELIYQIESNFLFNKVVKTGNVVKLSEVKILPPVIPSKVVGLAYNYKDLVGKQKNYSEPLIFLKPSTSVVGMNDEVIIPDNKRVWGEVELAIVIGRKAKNISPDKSNEYIFGYTVANDITMQNIESRDHHLARSKGCDTFCPLGPWIVPDIETSELLLTNKINNKVFQEGRTSNRIINDVESVSLVSRYMTLYPGDVIITGTPKNAMNSLLFNGSVVSVTVEGIGTLVNKVKKKEWG
jgi:2-keto-4-pentenoate hydratase/2-oxohepta-3-ene-1,7-dioic acid hydratase in catechol pathway